MFQFQAKLHSFISDESGAGTAWALGWLILCFSLAGIAIDVSNGWRVREFLQATADSTALAGAMELPRSTAANVRADVLARANFYATANMNTDRFGDVLLDADIVLGTWNADTETFTAQTDTSVTYPNAVLTITRQEGGASSVIGTFFLRFVGFDFFTSNAVAIAMTEGLKCHSDGLVAAGTVSLRAQQDFSAYCVHGDMGVNLGGSGNTSSGDASGSTFDADSMLTHGTNGYCGQSASGELCTDDHTPGISTAYKGIQTENGLAVPSSEEVSAIIEDLLLPLQEGSIYEKVSDPDTTYLHIFDAVEGIGEDATVIPLGGLLDPTPVVLTSTDFNPAQLLPGYIYELKCMAGDKSVDLGVPSDLTADEQAVIDAATGDAEGSVPSLGGFVLVSNNCDLVFDNSINYKNAVFAAAGGGTGRDSVRGTSYVQIGNMADGVSCNTDPVVIIGGNGVGFAGGLSSKNTQFIVDGNLNLAAPGNDESVYTQEGTNFWVNGNAYLSAGHSFSSCADRYDDIFLRPSIARLVF